jgi:protein-L-isoaspartate(D-aspartate) O-methyltransferase
MTLEECRRFYAEEVRLAAAVRSAALVEAFARVPRERFLGPGPWQIASADTGVGGVAYTATEDDDPRRICHNVPVALDVARNLNNGHPATLAKWIDALDLKQGDRVYHLGCGVGYYTAIIAHVVGSTGHVTAAEVDAGLAARAKENLAPYPAVEVRAGDGAAIDPGPCDAILVNAGVTHPLPAWLDRLREGGRMVIPLTVAMGPQTTTTLGKGVALKITRQAGAFPAQVISVVAIYSCANARDPRLEPLLAKAFGSGAMFRLKSVRRDAHDQADTCALHGEAVCLSTA